MPFGVDSSLRPSRVDCGLGVDWLPLPAWTATSDLSETRTNQAWRVLTGTRLAIGDIWSSFELKSAQTARETTARAVRRGRPFHVEVILSTPAAHRHLRVEVVPLR